MNGDVTTNGDTIHGGRFNNAEDDKIQERQNLYAKESRISDGGGW